MIHDPRLRRVVAVTLCVAMAWLPLPTAGNGRCACVQSCNAGCCGAAQCCCSRAGVRIELRGNEPKSGHVSGCCHGRKAAAVGASALIVPVQPSMGASGAGLAADEPQLDSPACRCGCCGQHPLPVVPPVLRVRLSKAEASESPLPHSLTCKASISGFGYLLGQIDARHARSLCVLLCVWRD